MEGNLQMMSNLRNIFQWAYIRTGIQQKKCWNKFQKYTEIHPNAIISPASALELFFRPLEQKFYLTVGEYSQIFSQFHFYRQETAIRIGSRCQLGNSHFCCAESIDIGDDVLIAWGVTVIDTDTHSVHWEHRKHDAMQCYHDYMTNSKNFIENKDWSNVPMKPIVIEDKAWIGFDSTILKGVTIGEGSVVGAKSVVTRNVDPYTVIAGNPAKVVRKL